MKLLLVEIYAAVRRFVFVEGKSRREAARVFGLSAALAVASLTNRPDKVARVTWAKGVAAWRSEHHCPLVFGRVE
jgi:hypothetical protein